MQYVRRRLSISCRLVPSTRLSTETFTNVLFAPSRIEPACRHMDAGANWFIRGSRLMAPKSRNLDIQKISPRGVGAQTATRRTMFEMRHPRFACGSAIYAIVSAGSHITSDHPVINGWAAMPDGRSPYRSTPIAGAARLVPLARAFFYDLEYRIARA
jgi:hypothetical protein